MPSFKGQVDVTTSTDQVTIKLDGEKGDIRLGGNGQEGTVLINDINGVQAIQLNGKGNVYLGGKSIGGNLAVQRADGSPSLHLSGDGGNIKLLDAKGVEAIALNNRGNVYLGGKGIGGNLDVRRADGSDSLHLSGDGGHIKLLDANGVEAIALNNRGNVYLGGRGITGDLSIRRADGSESIHLDGEAGDIKLLGADCAEDFDVADAATDIGPGNVMVIDQDGKLRLSDQEYDKKVAGVVSGAGDYRPGIVLGKSEIQAGRSPIALVGKVFCKVDASYTPIEVGDLLTTSPTAGHAMKAIDPFNAFGAVIGKALRPLRSGQGLIPILIALQ